MEIPCAMKMNSALFLGVVLAVISSVYSWMDLRSFAQKWECGGLSSKCFKSSDCCAGYVCVTYEDENGNEILPFDVAPGYCAKEMAGSISTATCKTRDDCNDLEDCVEIGQQPLRMCVSMTADSTDGDGKRGKKGKYGEKCYDSSDCAVGCCQERSIMRRGVRRTCERIQSYSRCIKSTTGSENDVWYLK